MHLRTARPKTGRPSSPRPRRALAAILAAAVLGAGFATPATAAFPPSSGVVAHQQPTTDDGEWTDGMIAAAMFTSAPSPTISGTVRAGSRIAATAGAWSPAAAFSYQWYRNGSPIKGATSASYAVVFADANAKLKVRVRGARTGYASTDRYSAEKPVPSTTFSKAPAPAISGTARVGNKLTARTGTWSPSARLAYQWNRNGSAIRGATTSSYTPTAADKGNRLTVRVRASRSGFTSVSRVSAARTVGAGTIKPTRALSISGSVRYGNTVKTGSGWPSGSKASHQWYRDGKAIKGATRTTFRPGARDIGHKLQVRATVTKSGYATYRSASRSHTIGSAILTAKSAPRITGTKKAGSTVRASVGTYSAKPTSYSFRWYRNGKAIPGATASTYRLATSDNGRKITVRVTAKRKYHASRTTQSAAISIPVPPRTVISRDGTYKVGSTFRPGLYKATGSGSACYWERTSGFSGSFSQIKANHFGAANTYVRIVAGDKGFTTRGCGSWRTVASSGAQATRITRDGSYRIGVDVRPGTYFGTSRGSSCYWEIVDDFTGDFDDLEENYFGSARTIVDVPSSAAGIRVSGCGTLVRR